MGDIENMDALQVAELLRFNVFLNYRDGNYYLSFYDPTNIKKRRQLTLKTDREKQAA